MLLQHPTFRDRRIEVPDHQAPRWLAQGWLELGTPEPAALPPHDDDRADGPVADTEGKEDHHAEPHHG